MDAELPLSDILAVRHDHYIRMIKIMIAGRGKEEERYKDINWHFERRGIEIYFFQGTLLTLDSYRQKLMQETTKIDKSWTSLRNNTSQRILQRLEEKVKRNGMTYQRANS